MPQQATNDVPTLKEKVTFEQGQYLRDGGGPNLTKYDYWVKSGDFETAGKIMRQEAASGVKWLLGIGAVAIGGFIISVLGAGSLVSIGIGSLTGSALILRDSHKEKKHEE